MNATFTMIELPIDFVVIGKPVSHQSKDGGAKQRWKATVKKSAQEVVGDCQPTGMACKIVIIHFNPPEDGMTGCPDGDNIWKLIQDALNGVVFVDDQQVTDWKVGRRSLDGIYRIRGVSPRLATALSAGKEFIHIFVDVAPDHSNLANLWH